MRYIIILILAVVFLMGAGCEILKPPTHSTNTYNRYKRKPYVSPDMRKTMTDYYQSR
jgi:hypothetical protein